MAETGDAAGWPPRAGADESGRGGEAPVRLLVAAEQTGGRFAVVERRTRRGQEPPLHGHTREDVLVYVLEGRVTFVSAGEWRPGPPGTCLLLPRGVEHGYRVESDEARLLVLLAPAGLEGLYDALGRRKDGAAPDVERLITAAAGYGVEITGPPPGRGAQG